MKKSWRKQRGLSIWVILGLLFVALIVWWIGVKVIPEYVEAGTVERCLKDARGAGGGDLSAVRGRFTTCLTTNSIREGVTAQDIKKRGTNTYVLTWEKRVPMIGNASLLLEFYTQEPK